MSPAHSNISRRSFVKKAAAFSSAAFLYSCSRSGDTDPLTSTITGPSGNPDGQSPLTGGTLADEMPRRKLGNTDLYVSCLSFGGGSQFKANGDGTWEPLLERAIELGVNYFDTHRGYGTEDRYGEILPACRDRIYLATKTDSRDNTGIRNDLDESLKQLRTDYLDVYLLHDCNGPDPSAWEVMQNLKSEGLVKYIGFSNMSDSNGARAIIEQHKPDIALMAMSACGYGGFKDNALPAAVSGNSGVLAMKTLRYCTGQATARELLAYVLDLEGVSTALVGHAGGAEQLEENVGIVKEIASTVGIRVDRAELERRLAPLADPYHMKWARADYRDDGDSYMWC